jgi:NitT/TauT family transport system ATP-binding protein
MAVLAPPERGTALHIEGVSKSYPSQTGELLALAPTNLSIRSGELLCIVGPSGCGKSTLLSIAAGLEPASGGQVVANGLVVTGPSPERILLFQEPALFPWLDVRANVEFGLRERGISRVERAELAESYIDMVHLTGFEASYVHQLSGGMRQRAAIARALAMDPALLLMDEPFGALDALTRDRLHEELEAIWADTGKTILFVTHNVREAVALGDRVLVFSPRPGRIVAEFAIDLPRTRSLQDHRLADKASEILDVLLQHEEDAAPGALT